MFIGFSAKQFSRVFLPIYIPTVMCESSHCSTFLTTLNIFRFFILAFLMGDPKSLELYSNTCWGVSDPDLEISSCKWCIWISYLTMVCSIFSVIKNQLIFFRNLPSKPNLLINKGFEKPLRGQFFNSITFNEPAVSRTYIFWSNFTFLPSTFTFNHSNYLLFYRFIQNALVFSKAKKGPIRKLAPD